MTRSKIHRFAFFYTCVSTLVILTALIYLSTNVIYLNAITHEPPAALTSLLYVTVVVWSCGISVAAGYGFYKFLCLLIDLYFLIEHYANE